MTASSPHVKTKLSLDLGNFSGIGSPASPSSPSYSGCPSPTFSGSWNMDKSQAELTSMLKETYNLLKHKETGEYSISSILRKLSINKRYNTFFVECLPW